MTIVLLFNGPPRSGKDTAASLAQEILSTSKRAAIEHKISYPLKDAVHRMFGLGVPIEYFEETKEEAADELLGHIPREEYIALSESYIKPRFGKDFFGKVFVKNLKVIAQSTLDKDLVICVSDCGFIHEVIPIVEYLSPSNVILVRMRREGTDFSKDSRSYLMIPELKSFDIDNNGTIDDLKKTLDKTLRSIVN